MADYIYVDKTVRDLATVTNNDFITEIFDKQVPVGFTPAICTKVGDPGVGGYNAQPAFEVIQNLTPDNNNYISNAAFDVAGDQFGKFSARGDLACGVFALLIDDYGTKVPPSAFNAFPLYSLIETSPGNYQGIILLNVSVSVGLAQRIIKAMISKGLCDPGATGGVRWMRLPYGINGKPEYADPDTGRPFHCRLEVFNPLARYTPQEIIGHFDLTIDPECEYLAPKGGMVPSGAYTAAALTGEIEKVEDAVRGRRNAQLYKSSASLGGFVGAGSLSRSDAEVAMLHAALFSGLSKGEALTTIRSGLDNGSKQPRHIPNENLHTKRGRDASLRQSTISDGPIPLHRELRPSEPFPVKDLGDVLSGAVDAIVDVVKCPTAIAAGSVLAAASLAVMGHANVIHPATGRRVPLSLYLLEIGESGERKSEADALAMDPVRRREDELRDGHVENITQYKIEHRAWELAKKKREDAAKGDRDATRKALTELGPEPPAPLSPELIVGEPTFEGLQNCFASGYPVLGLFSDEGGSFIGGHAMSEEAKLRSAAGLCRLWDGKAIDRTRAKEKLIMHGRRLAVHLMAQPDVASLMISDPMLSKQGYLARFLICHPESTKGHRFYSERRQGTNEALRRYSDRLLRILQMPLPIIEGTQNVLNPREISLGPAALDCWRKFSDHVEAELGDGGELRRISEFASKLGEQVLRLAATIALVEDISTAAISLDHLSRAIKVADFYTTEMLRLHDAGYVTPEIKRAQSLLAWLRSRWGEEFISLPEIYQRGPSSIRDKNTAQSTVNMLVEHGHLFPTNGSVTVAGKSARKAWRVVREG